MNTATIRPVMTVGELKAALADLDDTYVVQIWLPGTRIQLEQVLDLTDNKATGGGTAAVLIEGRVIMGGMES